MEWRNKIQSNILKQNHHLNYSFWCLRLKTGLSNFTYRNWLKNIWETAASYKPDLKATLGITRKAFDEGLFVWPGPPMDPDFENMSNFRHYYEGGYRGSGCQPVVDKSQEGDLPICDMRIYNHHVIIIIYSDGSSMSEAFRSLLNNENWFRSLISKSYYQNVQRGTSEAGKRKFFRPFGFQDGIANPKNSEVSKIAFGETLFSDTGGDHFGTYLFLQKYELNTKAFNDQAKKIKRAIHQSGNIQNYVNDEYGKAMLMGRFPNGTPLVKEKEPTSQRRDNDNNFSYGGDPNYNSCPIHAHIRVVNPRDKWITSELTIIRRSVVFYETQRNGCTDQSMIFMSYQHKLEGKLRVIFNNIFNGTIRASNPAIGSNEDAILYNNPIIKGYDLKYPIEHGKNNGKVSLSADYTLPTSYVTGAIYYVPSLKYINQEVSEQGA